MSISSIVTGQQVYRLSVDLLSAEKLTSETADSPHVDSQSMKSTPTGNASMGKIMVLLGTDTPQQRFPEGTQLFIPMRAGRHKAKAGSNLATIETDEEITYVMFTAKKYGRFDAHHITDQDFINQHLVTRHARQDNNKDQHPDNKDQAPEQQDDGEQSADDFIVTHDIVVIADRELHNLNIKIDDQSHFLTGSAPTPEPMKNAVTTINQQAELGKKPVQTLWRSDNQGPVIDLFPASPEVINTRIAGNLASDKGKEDNLQIQASAEFVEHNSAPVGPAPVQPHPQTAAVKVGREDDLNTTLVAQPNHLAKRDINQAARDLKNKISERRHMPLQQIPNPVEEQTKPSKRLTEEKLAQIKQYFTRQNSQEWDQTNLPKLNLSVLKNSVKEAFNRVVNYSKSHWHYR